MNHYRFEEIPIDLHMLQCFSILQHLLPGNPRSVSFLRPAAIISDLCQLLRHTQGRAPQRWIGSKLNLWRRRMAKALQNSGQVPLPCGWCAWSQHGISGQLEKCWFHFSHCWRESWQTVPGGCHRLQHRVTLLVVAPQPTCASGTGGPEWPPTTCPDWSTGACTSGWRAGRKVVSVSTILSKAAIRNTKSCQVHKNPSVRHAANGLPMGNAFWPLHLLWFWATFFMATFRQILNLYLPGGKVPINLKSTLTVLLLDQVKFLKPFRSRCMQHIQQFCFPPRLIFCCFRTDPQLMALHDLFCRDGSPSSTALFGSCTSGMRFVMQLFRL